MIQHHSNHNTFAPAHAQTQGDVTFHCASLKPKTKTV